MAKVTRIIREDTQWIVDEMKTQLQALAGTTLLVTGAGGFLCSYFLDLAAALNDSGLKPPCRVIGVDNFQSGLPDRLEHLAGRPDFLFMQHDVAKPLRLSERVDWIIHGASIASPPYYRQYPLETIDANVGGTRNLLELARGGIKSMLFMSTSEIYGDPDPAFIPTSEDYRGFVSCTGPRACYDESKRMGETLCTTYFRLFKTPVKAIRPFNVFGPGQRLDDGRIMPDLMSAALDRRPIVLFSDGRASRSFCYIRDAIRGMLFVLLLGADGEAYNVGNDMEEIDMANLAKRVSSLVHPALPVEYRVSPDQHYVTDNPQRRCPNLKKLRALAPWQPVVGLTEGLSRTLESYQIARDGG